MKKVRSDIFHVEKNSAGYEINHTEAHFEPDIEIGNHKLTVIQTGTS